MSSLLKYVICSAVVSLIAGTVVGANPPGFLEGRLKISSPKEVELAETTPSKTTGENFAGYPLLVMSSDGKREVARIIADANGNYRVTLPPGVGGLAVSAPASLLESDVAFEITPRIPKNGIVTVN